MFEEAGKIKLRKYQIIRDFKSRSQAIKNKNR